MNSISDHFTFIVFSGKKHWFNVYALKTPSNTFSVLNLPVVQKDCWCPAGDDRYNGNTLLLCAELNVYDIVVGTHKIKTWWSQIASLYYLFMLVSNQYNQAVLGWLTLDLH